MLYLMMGSRAGNSVCIFSSFLMNFFKYAKNISHRVEQDISYLSVFVIIKAKIWGK